MKNDLKPAIAKASIVFRGYNVANLGRTAELLAHAKYGPIVRQHLEAVGKTTSDVLGRKIDLVARVESGEETRLEEFADAIAMIAAVEIAQIECLAQFFDVHFEEAQLAAGYSLGEISAVVCGGVLDECDAITIPVAMADDCAELGRETRMGIVFSRGPALELDDINKMCLEINQEGRGVIGISAYLSPNSLLILGQHATVNRFNELMKGRLPEHVHLRKNDSRWPPMHTPIMWERHIPNRSASMMHTLAKGFGLPQPPILSLVTGKCSYNEYNAREILARWIDHPQRVWDAVYEILSRGVETVIHVGPQPNLFPATFKRLSDNVQMQLARSSPSSFRMRVMSGMVRRQWLAAMLPSRTALLRAPFMRHVILEDWLLEQEA
jgi:[acyl-carrier-protein] S-malonyltransferase